MDDEMSALISRGTWELVEPPPNTDVVACRWVFTLKFWADGTLDRYKARLLLRVSPKHMGVLEHGFDKFSRIIGDFGFRGAKQIIQSLSKLQDQFVTKDLGRPRYFLGIEIAHSKHGVSLSQKKYACDLLQETGLLGTKSVDTPMDSNPNFWKDDGNYLKDKTKYRRLVGKLIYLTVTRPDISFAVGLVSQFMDKPRSVHWEATLRILKYIKASPGKGLLFKRHGHVKIEAYSDADYAGSKDDRKSTSGYCTYVGGNLVTWRSKK
ncbi:UNVERIFIED_CONTAM: Retrovirus-related Pol polyprotein from transposon RE2 [Sesamum latifolium]|uniref:Retrovirus-related Pol polyprotein from transposon RE2 n=1 Tax=Sesamum latifolium TaxID=2727402 RepID=A0AAW2XG24_9LAMI